MRMHLAAAEPCGWSWAILSNSCRQKGGEVIGEGWHQRAGGPHAEVNALQDARARGRDARGATLYSTLEPCNHVGRTPSCAEAAISAVPR